MADTSWRRISLTGESYTSSRPLQPRWRARYISAAPALEQRCLQFNQQDGTLKWHKAINGGRALFAGRVVVKLFTCHMQVLPRALSTPLQG